MKLSVKIFRRPTIEEWDKADCFWMDEMEKFVGKTFDVEDDKIEVRTVKIKGYSWPIEACNVFNRDYLKVTVKKYKQLMR